MGKEHDEKTRPLFPEEETVSEDSVAPEGLTSVEAKRALTFDPQKQNKIGFEDATELENALAHSDLVAGLLSSVPSPPPEVTLQEGPRGRSPPPKGFEPQADSASDFVPESTLNITDENILGAALETTVNEKSPQEESTLLELGLDEEMLAKASEDGSLLEFQPERQAVAPFQGDATELNLDLYGTAVPPLFEQASSEVPLLSSDDFHLLSEDLSLETSAEPAAQRTPPRKVILGGKISDPSEVEAPRASLPEPPVPPQSAVWKWGITILVLAVMIVALVVAYLVAPTHL